MADLNSDGVQDFVVSDVSHGRLISVYVSASSSKLSGEAISCPINRDAYCQ